MNTEPSEDIMSYFITVTSASAVAVAHAIGSLSIGDVVDWLFESDPPDAGPADCAS